MNKWLLFIAFVIFYSCIKEPIKAQKFNSFSIDQEIENNSETYNQKTKKQIESKYSYIKTLEGKYPDDINLFESGILRTKLLELLGQETYNLFIKNMGVQNPIEIIDNEYAFVSGGAPHNFGSEEDCIEIDFVNNVLSVGILTYDKRVLYFTEKETKSVTRRKLKEWFSEVNKITMNKNIK